MLDGFETRKLLPIRNLKAASDFVPWDVELETVQGGTTHCCRSVALVLLRAGATAATATLLQISRLIQE